MKPPGYRHSTVPDRMCASCGAFTQEGKALYGHCAMYDVRVGAKMVCNKWYAKGSEPPKP